MVTGVFGTRVLPCKCKSPMQDKMYGDGMRLWNVMKAKVSSNIAVRCSICCTEREFNEKSKMV